MLIPICSSIIDAGPIDRLHIFHSNTLKVCVNTSCGYEKPLWLGFNFKMYLINHLKEVSEMEYLPSCSAIIPSCLSLFTFLPCPVPHRFRKVNNSLAI